MPHLIHGPSATDVTGHVHGQGGLWKKLSLETSFAFELIAMYFDVEICCIATSLWNEIFVGISSERNMLVTR